MGQVIPFPSIIHDRSRTRRRPPAYRCGRIRTLVPSSRLFIAGMAVQSPVIAALQRHMADIGDRRRPAQERILERLITSLPAMPDEPDNGTFEHLAGAPMSELVGMAHVQLSRSASDRRNYAIGQLIWRSVDDPSLRRFAQRMAIILIEALHLGRQARFAC